MSNSGAVPLQVYSSQTGDFKGTETSFLAGGVLVAELGIDRLFYRNSSDTEKLFSINDQGILEFTIGERRPSDTSVVMLQATNDFALRFENFWNTAGNRYNEVTESFTKNIPATSQAINFDIQIFNGGTIRLDEAISLTLADGVAQNRSYNLLSHNFNIEFLRSGASIRVRVTPSSQNPAPDLAANGFLVQITGQYTQVTTYTGDSYKRPLFPSNCGGGLFNHLCSRFYLCKDTKPIC